MLSHNHLGRRHVLGGAALGASALAARGALAKMPMGQAQAPYFYRFKLGSAECTIVSDRQLRPGSSNNSFVNIGEGEIALYRRDRIPLLAGCRYTGVMMQRPDH